MVLVMENDGTLTPSRAQERFARNYNDGLGQGSAATELQIFGEDSEESDALRVAAIAPTVRAPHPDILAAIEETALRYAGHLGLRAADITVTDWLNLYRANIEIESAYDPSATSSVGALGLGQLMPETAADLGVDPDDVAQNLDGSARYLLAMLNRFGDEKLALAAYNAGPEAVARHGGIPPFEETRNHVVRVMAVAERLAGETR